MSAKPDGYYLDMLDPLPPKLMGGDLTLVLIVCALSAGTVLMSTSTPIPTPIMLGLAVGIFIGGTTGLRFAYHKDPHFFRVLWRFRELSAFIPAHAAIGTEDARRRFRDKVRKAGFKR